MTLALSGRVDKFSFRGRNKQVRFRSTENSVVGC